MPKFLIFLNFQEDFYSTALKTLISVSTVILLGLIVAYHGLEVQVILKVLLPETKIDDYVKLKP